MAIRIEIARSVKQRKFLSPNRDMSITNKTVDISKKANYWVGYFSAMASRCEVFIDTSNAELARKLVTIAAQEAWRIEEKFSRYRRDNVMHDINHSDGNAIEVDAETARLLDFAQHCFQISEGLFDVTSGILRRVWQFDRSDRIPNANAVAELLPLIGWDKLHWKRPLLTLPEGMEIDLGGIGKEYAVDRTIQLLASHCDAGMLVNFGGDLHVNTPRKNGQPWYIGIENPASLGEASAQIEIYQGALATSGDSQRFLLKDNTRYSHVLNPHTGWPVVDAPRSVTVAADLATEAGILSTLAMLQGKDAETFLSAQNLRYWCQR